MPHDITINKNIKINQESSFESNENSAINKFWNTLNYYLAKAALVLIVILLITLYIVVIVILDLTYVHIKANPFTTNDGQILLIMRFLCIIITFL